MIIRRIKIENLGLIREYDITLDPELNILDTHFSSEISGALDLVLCRGKPMPTDLKKDTVICAEVIFRDTLFFIEAKPTSKGNVKLTAVDSNQNDVTELYRYLTFRDKEQDCTDIFDGLDTSIPSTLARYRECRAEKNGGLVETRTFRARLLQYVKNFKPEKIRSDKEFSVFINERGIFDVALCDENGCVSLSETEKKLFLFICFLNISEFWADFEELRDIHDERRPLVIKNFIEFLDRSASIDDLIARTKKLERQVIFLTLPMDDDEKSKWPKR